VGPGREESTGSSQVTAKKLITTPVDDPADAAARLSLMVDAAGMSPHSVAKVERSSFTQGVSKLKAAQQARTSQAAKASQAVHGPIWDKNANTISPAYKADGDLKYYERLEALFSTVFSDESNLESPKMALNMLTLGAYMDELRSKASAGEELPIRIVNTYADKCDTWSNILSQKAQSSMYSDGEEEDESDIMSAPKPQPRKDSDTQTIAIPPAAASDQKEWSDAEEEDGEVAVSPTPTVQPPKASAWLEQTAKAIRDQPTKALTKNKAAQRAAKLEVQPSSSSTEEADQVLARLAELQQRKENREARETAESPDFEKCITGPRIKFRTEQNQTVTCLRMSDFTKFAKQGKFAFVACGHGSGWVELCDDVIPISDDIATFSKQQFKAFKRSGDLAMPEPSDVKVPAGKEIFAKFYTSNVIRFSHFLPSSPLTVTDSQGYTTNLSTDVATAEMMKAFTSRLVKLETESARVPELARSLSEQKLIIASLAQAMEDALINNSRLEARIAELESINSAQAVKINSLESGTDVLASELVELSDKMSVEGTVQTFSDVAALLDEVSTVATAASTTARAASNNAAAALAMITESEEDRQEVESAISTILETCTSIEATNLTLSSRVDTLETKANHVIHLPRAVATLTGRVGQIFNIMSDPETHLEKFKMKAAQAKTAVTVPPTNTKSQAKVGTPANLSVSEIQPADSPASTFASKARPPADTKQPGSQLTMTADQLRAQLAAYEKPPVLSKKQEAGMQKALAAIKDYEPNPIPLTRKASIGISRGKEQSEPDRPAPQTAHSEKPPSATQLSALEKLSLKRSNNAKTRDN